MSEKKESRTQAIRGYVDGKIQWLWSLPENQRRAELAKLRRGIGHAPGELPELWGGLLQGMPASFYGTNGPSHEEWAVYLALTLYALHQQSNDTVCVSQLGCTLGRAVRRLAEQTVASGQDWTESSILRRFNALATAEEITEISHHLRGMIQLLRAAKPDSIPLDYPQLAVDLYGLQCDAPQLAQLPAVQLSILNNVSAYVRPGGVLVYATCTVLPEENGGVVSAFLDVHPDFAKEEFTLPGIGSCPGDVTLWPQRTGTDGFYICRMRRRG